MRLYSKSATNLGVIWHHTCISYKAFYFLGPSEVCGCGCGKIIKKRTRVVWECAEWIAIVRRVCVCAKIGCTQILWIHLSFYLILELCTVQVHATVCFKCFQIAKNLEIIYQAYLIYIFPPRLLFLKITKVDFSDFWRK